MNFYFFFGFFDFFFFFFNACDKSVTSSSSSATGLCLDLVLLLLFSVVLADAPLLFACDGSSSFIIFASESSVSIGVPASTSCGEGVGLVLSSLSVLGTAENSVVNCTTSSSSLSIAGAGLFGDNFFFSLDFSPSSTSDFVSFDMISTSGVVFVGASTVSLTTFTASFSSITASIPDDCADRKIALKSEEILFSPLVLFAWVFFSLSSFTEAAKCPEL
mmetsp:Transcript_36218/g.76345  ORF Transcript_36218/g.76345 Transcript_36218/m.76345 type:complete len:218 (+) Transcript_36218:274-927(+)